MARQGVGELDAGHAAPPDEPVPERRRPREHHDGVDRRRRSATTSGTPSRWRSARGSCSSSSRSRAAMCSASSSRGTPSSSPRWSSRRCSSRPSCCWCRCSSPCSTCRSSASSLLNNYWALWLPAGASAINVLLVKRFFENLPDGAHRGGAGRRVRTVPPAVVDRVAAVQADHRRRVGVRHPRRLEGLPLAARRASPSRRASRCRCACRRCATRCRSTCSSPPC